MSTFGVSTYATFKLSCPTCTTLVTSNVHSQRHFFFVQKKRGHIWKLFSKDGHLEFVVQVNYRYGKGTSKICSLFWSLLKSWKIQFVTTTSDKIAITYDILQIFPNFLQRYNHNIQQQGLSISANRIYNTQNGAFVYNFGYCSFGLIT